MSSGGSDARPRRLRLGRFEVVSHIGSGGMGAVYKAVDPAGREVALKVLAPEVAARPTALERFRREARHGVKLRHENIVGLYEIGESQGTYFLVMEYVNGITLHDYITRTGSLDPEESRQFLIQMARALDHAHSRGVIHRDIKPSNILITRVQDRVVAKLTDFGLARQDREEEFRVTRDGTTVGTVDYISPEQARDSRAADFRSDIYSLGCTFYHMLAGQAPFAEGSMPERIYKHMAEDPPDVRQLNPKIPGDLWAICQRMLAKNPEERFQRARDLLRALHDEEPASDEIAPDASAEAATQESDTGLQWNEAAPTALDDDSATAEQHRSTHAQYQRATEVLARGDFDQGIDLLTACCRLEPANVVYRQALRQAYLDRNKRHPARGIFARFSRWRQRMRSRLGFKKARKKSNHALALELGEEVLRHDPHNLEIQVEMAEAADAAGHLSLAVWLLTQAKVKNDLHVGVNRALARLCEKQKDYQRAMNFWAQVRKADPSDHEAWRKIKDLAVHDTISRARYQMRVEPGFADELEKGKDS
jgi:tetratricopeptide (TPR) repeat protein/predicted Ser/Thr protein kinase